MADLKNFTQDLINTTRVDYADTVKGFWGAQATLNFTGYTNLPVGTLRLTGIGTGLRGISQWSGTAYEGFKLSSSQGFTADIYDTFQPNIYGGASAGRWFQNFAPNTYLEYTAAGNTLGYVVNAAYRWLSTNDRLMTWQSRANEPVCGFTTINRGASATVLGQVYEETQNELGVTKASTAINVNTDGSSSYDLQLTPSGTARATDARSSGLRVVAGAAAGAARVIIGNAIDDGGTALQVKTLKVNGVSVIGDGGGKLLNTIYYTAFSTWLKSNTTASYIIVEVWGGGGSGGGCTAAGLNAGGGGAGGYALKRIAVSSLPASVTVVIGDGGATAVAATSNGFPTQFGSFVGASGGTGGEVSSSTASWAGGQGGIGTLGDLNLRGNPGESVSGESSNLVYAQSGAGGVTSLGGGAPSRVRTAGAGFAPALNSGGGGGGSLGPNTAGASGAAGFVIVREYS